MKSEDIAALAPDTAENAAGILRGVRQASPRRSLALLALGATLGLGIAAFSLFTAGSNANGGIPEGAVARVNQGQILESDFRKQVEVLTGEPFDKTTAAQRQEVLDSMIAEELLVQRGIEVSLQNSDAGVREALVAGVNLQTEADVLSRQPEESELHNYFQRHSARYVSAGATRLHHLLLPANAGAQPDAQAVVHALKQGTPIERVAAKFGLKELGDGGKAALPDVALKGALGDRLFAELGKLKSGDISAPAVADDGVHLLVVVQRDAPMPQTFEQARQTVAGDLRRDTLKAAQDEYVSFLRGKADVEVRAPAVKLADGGKAAQP
ncbi:peptidylprolyl isomerase [Uliginosibacterium sp. H3]|uniref:peptidylprolyl isomerase n=1 Tax=Uliginosibacterium silvisoli TaxID=3114758 RepID=A0ABU6K2K3_9RHOO|nr:peptidylprolyl isomerase [Uliginosibacterium sp. H3]